MLISSLDMKHILDWFCWHSETNNEKSNRKILRTFVEVLFICQITAWLRFKSISSLFNKWKITTGQSKFKWNVLLLEKEKNLRKFYCKSMQMTKK